MDAVNAGLIRQIGFHCSEHGLVMVKPDDGLSRVPWVCSRVTLSSARAGGPQICGKTLDAQVQAESTSCATCGHEPHAEKGCCLANLGIRVCSCRAGREGDSQPMPVVNDAPSVQSQVIADIEKRIELGIARYLKGALIEQEAREARMRRLVTPEACPPHPLTDHPCIDSPGHEASHSDGRGKFWWPDGFATSKDAQNVDTP